MAGAYSIVGMGMAMPVLSFNVAHFLKLESLRGRGQLRQFMHLESVICTLFFPSTGEDWRSNEVIETPFSSTNFKLSIQVFWSV